MATKLITLKVSEATKEWVDKNRNSMPIHKFVETIFNQLEISYDMDGKPTPQIKRRA